MKVHKEDHTVRPVINWMNVPADTLATRHSFIRATRFDARNTACNEDTRLLYHSTLEHVLAYACPTGTLGLCVLAL